MTRLRALGALALLAGTVLLAGCTGSPSPTSSPTASADRNSSLGITCAELVPAEVVSALNPKLKPIESFKPGAPNSLFASEIAALGGIACGWKTSDGLTLTVAAGKLPADTLAAKEAKVAAGSTATLVFGTAPSIRGYEINTGGTVSGDMEVFTEGGYWISAVSPLFFSPSDAESVVAATLQALPSG